MLIINGIMFKTKIVHCLELLIRETTELLRSYKSKITKDQNGECVPHLEITEVTLIHDNIVNNNYQQNSRIIYTFVSNKLIGQLLDILPDIR